MLGDTRASMQEPVNERLLQDSATGAARISSTAFGKTNRTQAAGA